MIMIILKVENLKLDNTHIHLFNLNSLLFFQTTYSKYKTKNIQKKSFLISLFFILEEFVINWFSSRFAICYLLNWLTLYFALIIVKEFIVESVLWL